VAGGQCECDVFGGVTHQPVEPGEGVLKVGILTEDGTLADTQTGTPQVGVCLPLIANVALSVLDEHFVLGTHSQGAGSKHRLATSGQLWIGGRGDVTDQALLRCFAAASSRQVWRTSTRTCSVTPSPIGGLPMAGRNRI
jgi:hypothetical protein